MKIKYVGLKDEETAFSPETGITWYPGSSHEIPGPIAKRMLAHPDVFEVDAEDAAVKATVSLTPSPAPAPAPAPSAPPPADAPRFVMGTPDGPLVLDAMERDDLVALAKQAGVAHHVNLGAEKLRALLVDKFPQKAE